MGGGSLESCGSQANKMTMFLLARCARFRCALHRALLTAPVSPRTLKEGLEGHSLDAETLVTVLFAELKAYKTVRADTGQERYNVLCDLLEICSEESGRLHERAIGLTELAQVLCYHSYAQQTDWWVDTGAPGSPPCVPEHCQGAFEGPQGEF